MKPTDIEEKVSEDKKADFLQAIEDFKARIPYQNRKWRRNFAKVNKIKMPRGLNIPYRKNDK